MWYCSYTLNHFLEKTFYFQTEESKQLRGFLIFLVTVFIAFKNIINIVPYREAVVDIFCAWFSYAGIWQVNFIKY